MPLSAELTESKSFVSGAAHPLKQLQYLQLILNLVPTTTQVLITKAEGNQDCRDLSLIEHLLEMLNLLLLGLYA